MLAQIICRREAADSAANDQDVAALGDGRVRECVAVANLVTDIEMFAFDFGIEIGRCGKERKIHGAAGGYRTCDHKFQKIAAAFAHDAPPSDVESTRSAAASSARAPRVRSLYQMTIVTMEKRRMSVEMALISGVMPRRRRDQISSGRVLSRPSRKKLTAISSSESVKISRPAAISETRKLGSVTRQNVFQ